MGYSGIGGQAVMEGVMMKNGIHYAVAVRKPDKEIVVDAREYPGIVKNQKIKKIPILRGVINFIDSLVLGMRTLMYSASFFERRGSEGKGKEGKCGNGVYGLFVRDPCTCNFYASSIWTIALF